MRRVLAILATGLFAAAIAFRVPHFDSPASVSLHEESTVAANRPGMGIFNNLILFKQDEPKNSMQAIVDRSKHRSRQVRLRRGRGILQPSKGRRLRASDRG